MARDTDSQQLCASCFTPLEAPPPPTVDQAAATRLPGQTRLEASAAPDANAPPCPRCGWQPSAERVAEEELTPGTVLRSRYQVGRVLGRGGFGITYLGFDRSLRRLRAIKEYFPRGILTRNPNGTRVTVYAGQKDLYQRGMEAYLAEAQLLARFEHHACIVSPLDFFEENGTAYLVMEHLDGETLRVYVERRGGKLPYAHVCFFMLPVLEALGAVHESGITHRDVSPDNVFLTTTSQAKLIDFGAARQGLAARAGPATVIVKDHYAPPEQYAREGKQGPWTDIYAAAATIYYALTGISPPTGPERLLEDRLRPPSALGISLSRKAEAMLMRALSLRPEDRPQEVEPLRVALQAARGGRPATPEGLATPRDHSTLLTERVAGPLGSGSAREERSRGQAAPDLRSSGSGIGSSPSARPVLADLQTAWTSFVAGVQARISRLRMRERIASGLARARALSSDARVLRAAGAAALALVLVGGVAWVLLRGDAAAPPSSASDAAALVGGSGSTTPPVSGSPEAGAEGSELPASELELRGDAPAGGTPVGEPTGSAGDEVASFEPGDRPSSVTGDATPPVEPSPPERDTAGTGGIAAELGVPGEDLVAQGAELSGAASALAAPGFEPGESRPATPTDAPPEGNSASRDDATERDDLAPPDPAPTEALIIVRSNVAGDTLSIDEVALGSTGPQIRRLPPGPHRLRVEKPGYAPEERVLDLRAGRKPVEVRFALRRLPSADATLVSAPIERFEAALAAQDATARAAALDELSSAATRGSPAAQHYLGRLHGLGRGVPADDALALGWMRKAASGGLAAAQLDLALRLEYGRWDPLAEQPRSRGWIPSWFGGFFKFWGGEIEQQALRFIDRLEANRGDEFGGPRIQIDDAATPEQLRSSERLVEALRWYQAAGDQDSALAQERAGFMQAGGRGTPRNVIVAFRKWFMLAAQQGRRDSQYVVGMCYTLGIGIQANEEHTEAGACWLGKAAAQGQPAAIEQLEAMGRPIPEASSQSCPVDYLP